MRQKRRLFCAHFAFSLSLLSAGLSTLAGCGDGKIGRYSVRGVVHVDGKPAEGVIVIFCPVATDDPEFTRQRPFSRTDAQGNYELKTFEPGDGAPVGDYQIMVRWTTPTAPAADRGADPRGGGGMVDRLRNRYTVPSQSGLAYTVVAGPNEVPPFELTTK